MQTRRILLLTPHPFFPWRGVALRTRHTAAALAQLGFAVDLLAPPGGDPPRDLPGVRFLSVPSLPWAARTDPGGAPARGFCRLLLAARALALACVNRYETVHGVEAAWPAAWLAARLCGAGAVYETAGDAPDGFRAAWRERQALRHADAVVTNEPAVAGRMRALRRESRACLIADIPGTWQAPDAGGRAEVRARLGAAEGTLVLTVVGSLRKFQGVDLVFNALPEVLRGEPRARLVMVGGTAGEIAAARALLRRANLEAAVVFLGRIPAAELAQVLAASDLLLAPRRGDARAPMRVLDYLRSGVAIVATDCAANRSVLTPECARFVRPSPEALAAGVLSLVRDPERRAALGEAGRARAARDHGFDAFQEALRRCYEYVHRCGGKARSHAP